MGHGSFSGLLPFLLVGMLLLKQPASNGPATVAILDPVITASTLDMGRMSRAFMRLYPLVNVYIHWVNIGKATIIWL